MSELSTEDRARLEEQHKEIRVLKLGGQVVVVRPPTEPEHFRFMDDSTSEKKSKSRAMKALGMSCVVVPDRETVAALCADKPMRYVMLANAAMAMASDDEDEADPKDD